MQIQHETCLIEPSPTSFAEHINKSLDSYCLLSQQSSSLCPIEQIALCPGIDANTSLLAVHLSANNQIVIIDTRSHERRDKFPLKACDKKFSRQSFHANGLAFSPDGQRLAVGQTDCIIYIYKLAVGPGRVADASQLARPSGAAGTQAPGLAARTTISGKFASTSPVTCLIWPEMGLIFGGQDGKVRLILSFNNNNNNKLPQLTQATSDHKTINSIGQDQYQQVSPPKVVTIFAGAKDNATPICLAYQTPALLIGLSNSTIQIVIFSLSKNNDPELINSSNLVYNHQSASNLLLGSQLIMHATLAANQPPSRRRNSTLMGVNSSYQAPTILQTLTIEHSCPPHNINLFQLNDYLIVSCSGSDGKLAFHTLEINSNTLITSQAGQCLDLKEDILAMDYSHINEILAIATKDKLMFVSYNQQVKEIESALELESSHQYSKSNFMPSGQYWRLHANTIELKRAVPLTAIKWTHDGTQLAVASSSGSLELFQCEWSKESINDKLDINHIARNRVRIIDREQNLTKIYKTFYDIVRINLLFNQEQTGVLIWTNRTLLLAKLSGEQSEINFRLNSGGDGGDNSQLSPPRSRFLFDANSNYVIIFHDTERELCLLRLGQDGVIFRVQLLDLTNTAEMRHVIKGRLLSVCQFPTLQASPTINRAETLDHSSRQIDFADKTIPNKPTTTTTTTNEQLDQTINSNQVERFAYLSSRCQLEIINLTSNTLNKDIYSYKHTRPIEWLSFSHTGRLLAFLDIGGQLNLLRIKSQQVVEGLVPGEEDQNQNQNQIQNRDGDGDSNEECECKFEIEDDLQVLLKNCSLDCKIQWLPKSDCLMAQADAIIYIWYDLHERGHTQTIEKFDTRNYNFLHRTPMIDLSLMNGVITVTDKKTDINWKYPKIRKLISGKMERDELAIELTNNQLICLDKTKILFYTKLASGSLQSALQLLSEKFTLPEGRQPQLVNTATIVNHTRLYVRLAWQAIETAQCELAWKIFNKLQYKPLARYLADCLTTTTNRAFNRNQTIDASSIDGPEHLQAIMLAKLSGNWDKFERLLARDQDELVATYRRLNKWSRLVNYLGRKQQFRQRDLAERDQIAWLLANGRKREAAELKAASSGDFVGALELLLVPPPSPGKSSDEELNEACDFVLRNQEKLSQTLGGTMRADGAQHEEQRRLGQLLEFEICNRLVAGGKCGQLIKAATIWHRLLGNSKRAVELYLEAGDHRAAVRVVRANDDGKTWQSIDAILLQCADNLRNKFRADRFSTSGKQARAAIDYYLECKQVARALEMANCLHLAARGYEILIENWDELARLKEHGDDDEQQNQRELVLAECRELAHQLQTTGEHVKVARSLEMAEEYQQLIEILLEHTGELERAYKISLEHVHAGNREAANRAFVELAHSYVTRAEADGAHAPLVSRAEHIYLLLDKANLAIEMHERLGNYERMLELIERHQTADQLEASLLQLARSLELAGKLDQAERYLLRAAPGEWTSVVRMYRLAKRWPDAYRVARVNCLSEQDPLLVQLAYWWAKSLLPPVAPSSSDDDSSELVKQSTRARALLNELNLFKQVIEFACEVKNFQFALNICSAPCDVQQQQHPNGCLSPTSKGDIIKRELVLRYATYLEQDNKFHQAERLLIDNNLVELAARMYIDNDQHTEAIRVIEQQLELTAAAGTTAAPGATTTTRMDQPEVEQPNRKQLVDLLNSTLIECARRIVANLGASDRLGTPPLVVRLHASRTANVAGGGGGGGGGQLQSAQSWSDKLAMAQEMFLRAQRPELAIEMYQSLGMWREAIQVAQRFAPRLLEAVERALDQQVQADIEPILRQTTGNLERVSGNGTEIDSNTLGSSEFESYSERVALEPNETLPRLAPQPQPPPPLAPPLAPVKAAGGGGALSSALSAWRAFEFAYRQDDSPGARTHFDKYLSLLLMNIESYLSQASGRKQLAGANNQVVARQLRYLDKFLSDCHSRRGAREIPISEGQFEAKLLIGSILRQRNIYDKIKLLAEQICLLDTSWCSLEFNCIIQSHASWLSLRNILTNCRHLLLAHQDTSNNLHLDERLLVAHYVTLYVSLVRYLSQTKYLDKFTMISQIDYEQAHGSEEPEAALDLVGKVSFALLRHGDLLDLGQLLYLAGLWQLACGRVGLTRELWSGLLDWYDSHKLTANSKANGIQKSFRLDSPASGIKRVPAPPVLVQLVTNLPANHLVAMQTNNLDSLGQTIRHWLLESLIGTTSDGAGANQAEANGRPPAWARLCANSLACLACGLPLTAASGRTLYLSDQIGMRAHELAELLTLSGDAQLNSHQSSSRLATPSHLKDILERRRRQPARATQKLPAVNGQKSTPPRNTGSLGRGLTARDQLNEIVDFIIDLSTLAVAGNSQ